MQQTDAGIRVYNFLPHDIVLPGPSNNAKLPSIITLTLTLTYPKKRPSNN